MFLACHQGRPRHGFLGFLKLFYNLGGASDDKRIRLFPVRFDKELCEGSSTSRNYILFGDVGREFRFANQREINQKCLASEGFNFGPHEAGFICFSIEGGKEWQPFSSGQEIHNTWTVVLKKMRSFLNKFVRCDSEIDKN
jgi:hypothetical protein